MKKHTQITMQLKELLDCDERLKRLVEQSICFAAEENPDPVKNPVRSLEQFYDFIDFTQTVMPWAYLPEECFENFVTKTDQSCLYIYYLLDRPFTRTLPGIWTRAGLRTVPTGIPSMISSPESSATRTRSGRWHLRMMTA